MERRLNFMLKYLVVIACVCGISVCYKVTLDFEYLNIHNPDIEVLNYPLRELMFWGTTILLISIAIILLRWPLRRK
jgi:hypothetical protein